MKTSLWLSVWSAALLASSCTTIGRGTVTKHVDGDEARVELGAADGLAEGGRVDLFQKNCQYEAPSGAINDSDTQDCQDLRIGGGTVTAVQGPHQAVIKLDEGTSYAFGTIVKPAAKTAH